MRVTTADKFLLHEGMTVWNASLAVVKVTWVRSHVDVFTVDEEQELTLTNPGSLRMYHPETGVRASDVAHDAEEVQV